MEKIIKASELKNLREFKSISNLNPIITVKKGIIEKYIKGVPTENGRYKLGNIGGKFADYSFGIELFKNKNEDKIKVNVHSYYSEENRLFDKLHIRLYDVGEINRYEMYLRVNFITVLTFMHIIPESKVDLYTGKQTSDNLMFSIARDEYLSKKRNSMNEDVVNSDQFAMVFNYLWYHLVDDITGKDTVLKKISMEEHLILK